MEFGAKEGRDNFTDFDGLAYAERYPDLKEAYGDDLPALCWHYQAYGKDEGRDAYEEPEETEEGEEGGYTYIRMVHGSTGSYSIFYFYHKADADARIAADRPQGKYFKVENYMNNKLLWEH